MAAITYTALDNGALITDSPGAHTAGSSYSFDLIMQSYNISIDQPKTQHTSLNGNVETILQRSTKMYTVLFIWAPALQPNVEEWLYSIAGGAAFTFDPFGTVAVSDDPIQVVSVSGNIDMARLQPKEQSYMSTTLTMRPVP